MNNSKSKKRIAFMIPSLKVGGMERVMSEIVNYFADFEDLEIILILMTTRESHYTLKNNVQVIRPREQGNMFKTFLYLRKTLKQTRPYSLLSFGSMYNSFVILASLHLNIKVYVSDRSNPRRNTYLTFKKDKIERHDGVMHFILKRILYKKTAGILAQTALSKSIEERTLKHKNVVHIPNPIKEIKHETNETQENIILNVGRFIKTKQQKLLIDIFDDLDINNWKLVFLGDGPELDGVKKYASRLKSSDRVVFKGSVTDVDSYYGKAKIFAFTSVSEGFPNVLAEALNSGLACISFDCEAGPSDLIINDYNGYLIALNKVDVYKKKLEMLVYKEEIRNKFVKNSVTHMKNFDRIVILEKIKKNLLSG
jgi:GalNAc-alpha-(1->4)-GalNAc-alpha-(1->3)-diNAcBac-PP-undecaprenol alpha-1,4-N-acetyl-D-galactosaminyltransferase